MNRKGNSNTTNLRGAGNSSNRIGTIKGSKLSSMNKNIPKPVHEMVSDEQVNQVPSGYEAEGSQNTVNSNIIIITPDSGNLLNNPIKLAKALDNSPFKKAIKDVRTNKRKNLIVLELSDTHTNNKTINDLLKINSLGECKVTCSQPITGDTKLGVIYPVSLDVQPEELLNLIKIRDATDNESTKLIKIERLKKRQGNNTWEDSLSLKLTFSGNALPNAVSIYHSYYRIKPFVGPPLQCYNCQRMGHTAPSCKANTRCLLCGENHNKNECTKREENFKCANCSGNHKANSINCTRYKIAKDIESVRAYNNKTYQEAKLQVLTNTKTNHTNEQTQSFNGKSSYRDALSGNSSQNEEINNIQQQDFSTLNESFFNKLKICIMDVVTTVLSNMKNNQIEDLNLENVVSNSIKTQFQNKRQHQDLSETDSMEEDVLLAPSQPKLNSLGNKKHKGVVDMFGDNVFG